MKLYIKLKISSIFHFEQVNEGWITAILYDNLFDVFSC